MATGWGPAPSIRPTSRTTEEHSPVEIQDPDNEQTLNLVGLRLTRAEAAELRDKLSALLENPFLGRHEHVSSEDYQVEISVWLADDDKGAGSDG